MTDKHTIVYLVGGPLTERWIQYYCLDTLCNHYNVEFWDCSALLEHPYHVTNIVQRQYVVSDIDKKNIKQHLKQLPSDTVVVVEIGFHKANYNLLKLVSKYVHNCVIIDVWQSPVLSLLTQPHSENESSVIQNKSTLQTFKQFLYKNRAILIFCKLLRYGPTSKFIEQYKSIRLSNEAKDWNKWADKCYSLFKLHYISTDTKCKYRINNVDVEKYLAIKDASPILNERYIVYIGQFFPYHSDFVSSTHIDDIDALATEYYKDLNGFFKRLEKKYDCSVVIAEHPSAKYENNPFDGRRIFFYKTAELVRDSIGVCMHYSNSSSFVALYDKPLAIITGNVFDVGSFMQLTQVFASNLNMKCVDICDSDNENLVLNKIPTNKRKRIISSIVCNEDLHNSKLYLKHFNSIFEEIVKCQIS